MRLITESILGRSEIEQRMELLKRDRTMSPEMEAYDPEMDEAYAGRDIKGKHPGDKDYIRMMDLKDKAGGDPHKAIALAQAMARAIGRGTGSSSREKAHRRARAAREVFSGRLADEIAQMFMDAADVGFLPRSTG